MKINKITLMDGIGTFGEKTIEVFNNQGKPVNIFYMPNTSGKSLIFNSLEHLFSHNTKNFIKKTNKEIGVEIEFKLNSDDYNFYSSFTSAYNLKKNGTRVNDFGNILKDYLGFLVDLKYHGKQRNTLRSLNRFSFLGFSKIRDNEEKNNIALINSTHDGNSKKLLLAYILGHDIDNSMFHTITDYEDKLAFLNKNKKFEKILKGFEHVNLINNNLYDLYNSLEELRMLNGDINNAIKQLSLLKFDYKKVIGEEDEDYNFICNELNTLEKIKKNNKEELKNIKNEIKNQEKIEIQDLLEKHGNTLKTKEILDFEKYKQIKEDIKNIDELEIENYITINIDPKIKEFQDFLVDLYNVFIEKCLYYGEFKDEDIPSRKNAIQFDVNKLSVEAFFRTSEGLRKTLRILTFMGLHIFSKNSSKQSKCLKTSFYDSCLENIDFRYRKILFETIFTFIENKSYKMSDMFFFVTKVDDNSNDSINDLETKFPKYVKLIDSNGLKN